MATYPVAPGGSPPLQSGGQNQKWPTSGQGGSLPLPPGGSPPLQSGGQNQKWPTNGQGGYITPAAWGVRTAAEQGTESGVARKWARWLHNPCRLGGPRRFGAGADSEVAHKWARWLHIPCRLRVPTASERGENQMWPTSGQGGYMTAAARGVPTASRRGAESDVAHTWARWLHNPCRVLGPHRFRAGGKIIRGPQVGKVATYTVPPEGSPPLQSEGQNQMWPTSGQGGYITPATSGIPTASERGGRIRSGPQVGKVAT